MSNQLFRLATCLSVIVLGASFCEADLVVTGGGAYVIDFDNTVDGVNTGEFAGTGFQDSSTGYLSASAWEVAGLDTAPSGETNANGIKDFGETANNGPYARGTVYTQPGISSVDLDGSLDGVDRALGLRPDSTNFNNGSITLRIQNSAASVVNHWDFSYDIAYFNNSTEQTSITFAYATTDNSSFQEISALDFSSPAGGLGTGWQNASQRIGQINSAVQNGDYLYVRWIIDGTGSGNGDSVALDNLTLTASAPEPASMTLLGIGAIAGIFYTRQRKQKTAKRRT